MILMIKKFLNIFWNAASLKTPDSTVYDNFEEKGKSEEWNKSPELYLNILKIYVKSNKVEVEKRWKKESSETNNSTLSLNITAYENSIKAVSNHFNDKNTEDLEKEKSGTTIPFVYASTILIQNPFEFPRQQNFTVPLPEVSQFKASQRLVTPTKDSVLNEVMAPISSNNNNTFSAASSAVTQDVMTISINNVVCNFSLPMHIDLRKLALNTWNVSYDRSASVVTKRKRHPRCQVKIFNSGKVYIVGCKSEAASRQAARAVGREIQKIMGKTDQRICLRKFRINNILATCKFPFGILIDQVNRKYPKETYYEPELTVGLIWRMTEPKASIRIHTTGTIVVTGATSEADVSVAVEKIYDYVKDFQCDASKIARTREPRKRKSANNEAEIKSSKQKMDEVHDETSINWFYFPLLPFLFICMHFVF